MIFSQLVMDIFAVLLMYGVGYLVVWTLLYKQLNHKGIETRVMFRSNFVKISLLLCYVIVPIYFLLSRNELGDGMLHMIYGLFIVHAVLFQIVATRDLINHLKGSGVRNG